MHEELGRFWFFWPIFLLTPDFEKMDSRYNSKTFGGPKSFQFFMHKKLGLTRLDGEKNSLRNFLSNF